MDEFHILIVDDEPFHNEILRIRLEHEGFRVNCAMRGSQALQKLRESKFDLIISDFHIPDMDGIDLARHIRLLDIKVPIIMITGGDVSFKRILDDKDANISTVLTKPVNFRSLLNIVTAEKNKMNKEAAYDKSRPQNSFRVLR